MRFYHLIRNVSQVSVRRDSSLLEGETQGSKRETARGQRGFTIKHYHRIHFRPYRTILCRHRFQVSSTTTLIPHLILGQTSGPRSNQQ